MDSDKSPRTTPDAATSSGDGLPVSSMTFSSWFTVLVPEDGLAPQHLSQNTAHGLMSTPFV